VLQTGFGSGFLPLGSELELDSKKIESEHLWAKGDESLTRQSDANPITVQCKVGNNHVKFWKCQKAV